MPPSSAGLLFIAVQINHPLLDAAFVTTTEYAVRETMKIFMAVFSLIGITGMYLRQVRQTGVLGLIGYVVLGVGYLAIFSIQVVGCVRPPNPCRQCSPATSTTSSPWPPAAPRVGDIGPMQILIQVGGFAYIVGGIIFGIALFRANVLARWAAALLAVGAVATLATSLLPELNQRLFAIPVSVALIGLGYSLWREQRTPNARPMPSPVSSQLDPAGAK